MQLLGKVGRMRYSIEGRERRIGAMMLLRSTANHRPTRFAVTHNGEVALAGDTELLHQLRRKRSSPRFRSCWQASNRTSISFHSLKILNVARSTKAIAPSLRRYLISFGYGEDLSWVDQVSISDLVLVRFVDHREHHALPQKST